MGQALKLLSMVLKRFSLVRNTVIWLKNNLLDSLRAIPTISIFVTVCVLLETGNLSDFRFRTPEIFTLCLGVGTISTPTLAIFSTGCAIDQMTIGRTVARLSVTHFSHVAAASGSTADLSSFFQLKIEDWITVTAFWSCFGGTVDEVGPSLVQLP